MTPHESGARALWLTEHQYCTEATWADLDEGTRDWWTKRARPIVDAVLGAALRDAIQGLHSWYEERAEEDHNPELSEYEKGRVVGITEGILAAALKLQQDAFLTTIKDTKALPQLILGDWMSEATHGSINALVDKLVTQGPIQRRPEGRRA